jgi:uncharacterized protein (TIGR03435 family)
MTGIGIQPGGRFTAGNVTVRDLLSFAYSEIGPGPLPDYRVSGGPSWMNEDRFDVTAKVPVDVAPDQFKLMVRALLVDRFKLRAHKETRELPVYALVVVRSDGKLGAQLRAVQVNCDALRKNGRSPETVPASRCGFTFGPGVLIGRSVTMQQWVTAMAPFLDRVVLDETKIAGQFDIELRWTPEFVPPTSGDDLRSGYFNSPIQDGPSVFTAIREQLGLRLESRRGPVDVVVIDHVERPTED